MKSILQNDPTHCLLCGGVPNYADPLDRHHVFGAAEKKNSEKYGLVVYLHHSKCHENGKNAVHRNANTDRALKRWAQKKAMKKYGWTAQQFRALFRKNYLEEET